MRVFPLLAPRAVLLLAVPAGAQECVPTTSYPEVDTCAAGIEIGVLGDCEYVDNDFCQPGCVFSVWRYSETNDIPGLQRSDIDHDDTCGALIQMDTIIY